MLDPNRLRSPTALLAEDGVNGPYDNPFSVWSPFSRPLWDSCFHKYIPEVYSCSNLHFLLLPQVLTNVVRLLRPTQLPVNAAY